MAYLTFNEYEDMGGKLEEEEFDLYEFQARKQIDTWTDCRVQRMTAVPEAVKKCMMLIIRYKSGFGVDAQAGNQVLASFNTDGYSESYGSVSDRTSAAEASLYKSVRSLLYGETDDEGTPLLYRGVYA